mmetsp:Transcript_1317/g.3050  ORF Transcript_1317/g.3050 Transcript_1317/m.3050 type:complete len:334 (+) Transcript_1317:130-1131(+)
MADQCSICLEALDGGVAALACGHRFHAACLARLAGATGTSSTRRGALTACPNCRTTSRVAPYKPAAYAVGDRVSALWGYKWYPGDVYAVKDGGSAYEIAWDDEDASNEIPASRVRAAPLTVDVDAPTARDAHPPALVTPQAASSQTTVVDGTRRGTVAGEFGGKFGGATTGNVQVKTANNRTIISIYISGESMIVSKRKKETIAAAVQRKIESESGAKFERLDLGSESVRRRDAPAAPAAVSMPERRPRRVLFDPSKYMPPGELARMQGRATGRRIGLHQHVPTGRPMGRPRATPLAPAPQPAPPSSSEDDAPPPPPAREAYAREQAAKKQRV